MICIKCKRKLKQYEHCYVIVLVEVIGAEVYKQITHKATICKGCWKGEGEK